MTKPSIRSTRASRESSRIACLVLPILCVSVAVAAQTPGLPFTEDFSTATLRDDSLTDANWSTAEQAVYLQWRNEFRWGPVSFSAGTNITADASNVYAVALGDVDADGDLDLVAGNYQQANKLYLNDGSGDPFGAAAGTNVTADVRSTTSLALGDVNGDGYLDLVVGNYYDVNRLYLNDGSGDPFDTTPGTNITADADATKSVALGDMDGDGDLDLVAGNAGQNKLYLNDGSGDPFDTVFAKLITGEIHTTASIALGDVDGDGDLDVFAGNYNNEVNRLYRNNGSDNPFIAAIGTDITADADNTNSVALGDLDGDGDLDVVAGNGGANRLYLNDGSGDPFDITTGTDITADEQFTTAVTLGDVDGDGDLDVVAGNLNQANRLYLNDGAGDLFDTVAGAEITADAHATYSLALGDMNGDGGLDVVAGNYGQANRFYLNDGSGTPFGTLGAGAAIGSDIDNTYEIALGDVDGDGDTDVVAGNTNGTNKLYLNDGSGASFDTVGAGMAIGTDTDFSRTVALGDVDGDGDLDVVAGNVGQLNKLYLNDGDSAPFDSLGAGAPIGTDTDSTFAIALGDVDGDGDLDVAAGNNGQTNKLYLNDGDSAPFDTVGAGAAIGTDADSTFAVGLGDVDGDGDLDVVAGNAGQTNKLYLNDGDVAPFDTVTAGMAIGTDTDQTLAVALGDVDGDGDIDVVVGNYAQTNKLYLNDGSGAPFDTLGAGAAIGTDSGTDYTYEIALGDVDGDGDLDVVAGNYGQADKLYLNDGTGAPFDTVTAGTAVGTDLNNTLALAVGDVDGDGNLDVVAGNYGQTNDLYLNDGASAPFAAPSAGTAAGADTDQTYAVAVGDLDGDGDLDIAAGNNGVTNKLYLNEGAGEFAAGAAIGTDTDATYGIALGDVDGDGDLDVAAGNYGQKNMLYLNDGDATPFSGVISGTGIGTDVDSTDAIALGDLDGDGDLDVVAGNYGQTNKLYLNDGAGAPFDTVSLGTDIGADADGTFAIALGDVDGDGDLDVVAGNNGQTNKLYLNDGDSAPFDSLGAGAAIGTDTDTTRAIALGDVDGDGDLDVVAGDYGQTSRFYLNDGDSAPFDSVGAGSDIGTGAAGSYAIALGDVDDDGDLDVAVGNNGAKNRMYLNDGAGMPFSVDSVGAGMAFGTATDSTLAIALGDMDGDGDVDVAAGNDGLNRLYLNRAYDTGLGTAASIKVNDTESNIARVTLAVADATNTSTTLNTSIAYYVSNDGGARWQHAVPGAAVDFPELGGDLRWKAGLASLSPVISPVVDMILIEENLLSPDTGTAGTLRDDFRSLDGNNDGALSRTEAGFAYWAEVKAYDYDGDGLLTMADLLELTLGPVGVLTNVYVNFAYTGAESGTQSQPFDTVTEAAAFVADNGVVNITPGTSGETLHINKDVTLKRKGTTGKVILGAP